MSLCAVNFVQFLVCFLQLFVWCGVNLFLISRIMCAVHINASYIKTINLLIRISAAERIKTQDLQDENE